MCFHSKQSKDAQTLQTRFKAKFSNPAEFTPTNEYNGFTFPKTPIITNANPSIIQMFNWGLLPNWATEIDFRKHTLNAKIETIHQKPSFKEVVLNRCLILINGFYEWQWTDVKGKNKIKFLVSAPNNQAFAVAGLYSRWQNQGKQLQTYTMLTTMANELMSEIHNSKKRMPFILSQAEEEAWLNKVNLPAQRNVELKAEVINENKSNHSPQLTLF